MWIVYVIQNNDGRLYKGKTNNLERRISEHRQGKTKSTRTFQNFKVVYTESYSTENEALMREKYLKSAAGRRFLKKKISWGSSVG